MRLFSSMVGRKLIMAVSGLLMVIFTTVHLLGNLSLFSGPDVINAYADMLQGLGPLLWIVRAVMLSALCLHIYLGLHLTLENRASGRNRYAVSSSHSVTFAGRSMIWTGLVIGCYLVYHLIHFTLQLIYPEYSSARNIDPSGRPDVHAMLAMNFRLFPVFGIYIFSLAAVGLHLSHGLQSMVQTLGLNSGKTLPVIIKLGVVAAAILFLGYAAIPAGIITGMAGR
jgi:succinate dehydrogenase / fumarate reductase cytochrome b subunit